jgi:HNH endonuclease
VTVDLDSLIGNSGHGAPGGDIASGPLDPEACRRLACDGTLTQVLVTRHPTNPHGHGHDDPGGHHHHSQGDPGGDRGLAAPGPGGGGNEELAARLRAAMTLLPPVLGGAPTHPLEVGRTSWVVQAAQRAALAVRDGGCVFPGCDRPLAWCEAHHLRHWLHGGPTDLANLALLCRAHHRTVHEGGWQLARAPDGRLTATPPYRHRPHQHPTAA